MITIITTITTPVTFNITNIFGRHLQISQEQIVKVCINENNNVLAIANDGQIVVWKLHFYIPCNSKIIYRTTLRDLCGRGQFMDAWFENSDLAVVLLSNNSVYTWSAQMECWTCLSDNSFGVLDR
eukprot:UN02717